jgi:4-alpha-glucanotransferase
MFSAVGPPRIQSESFKQFWESHKEWLAPYAVFSLLRDIFGTSEHWKWGKLSAADPVDIARLSGPGTEHHNGILFTYYLQFHLHLQVQHGCP